MLLGGRRAKKRASVLSTKAEKSREVLRSSIYEIVLFVVLISALYVQESDVISYHYNNYLQQQQQQQHVTDSRRRLSDTRNGPECGQFSLTGLLNVPESGLRSSDFDREVVSRPTFVLPFGCPGRWPY